MTFLPIVARELRVASRRRGTYWARTVAALAIVAVGTWVFLASQQSPPHEIALALFGIFTGMAVLFGLAGGATSTADCLSEEKREGTLGLLFLTDLKGYDVVFGKLAATSLNAFYGVLAVVPMLGVPLLLGGVAPAEFGRMALVAMDAVFFSVAIGIGISAMSRSAFKALVMTLALIFVFTACLPAAGQILHYLGKPKGVTTALFMPSPGRAYYLAWDVNYKGEERQFWWSLGVIHGLGWLFLGLASLISPRTWQDKPAGSRRVRLRERWQCWSHGNLAERSAFRKRLLEKNPFFWLAARARLKPAGVWAVLGLLACGWAAGLAKFHREWLNAGTYFVTAIMLSLLIKCWFALEAGRQLAEDRKCGSLELLLSTPLSVREILRGERLALQRQFFRPVLVVLAIQFLFMMTTNSEMVGDDRATWILLCTGLMATLATDLTALYWVGLWKALTAKNPSRAAIANFILILILPSIVLALIWLVVLLTTMSGAHEPTLRFFLGLWFGLGVAADLFFAAWARHKLLSGFRLAAAERYAPRTGLLKRLFSGRNSKAKLPPVVAGQR